jgi:hypothetical protein
MAAIFILASDLAFAPKPVFRRRRRPLEDCRDEHSAFRCIARCAPPAPEEFGKKAAHAAPGSGSPIRDRIARIEAIQPNVMGMFVEISTNMGQFGIDVLVPAA